MSKPSEQLLGQTIGSGWLVKSQVARHPGRSRDFEFFNRIGQNRMLSKTSSSKRLHLVRQLGFIHQGLLGAPEGGEQSEAIGYLQRAAEHQPC